MSPFPHKARSTARKLACAAIVCAGSFAASVAPALAHEANTGAERSKDAPEASVCTGQSFSQPFAALNDPGYYTLVEGSEFNGPEEGWELSGGAQIVSATRPDGSSGQVLDLPSGAEAVSPPVCVTLLYTTARMWAQTVQGGGAVAVSVSYAGTKTAEAPKGVGHVRGQLGQWTLSRPFGVRPQLAGRTEETRQVRFHLSAGGDENEYQLFSLYIDPRMS